MSSTGCNCGDDGCPNKHRLDARSHALFVWARLQSNFNLTEAHAEPMYTQPGPLSSCDWWDGCDDRT